MCIYISNKKLIRRAMSIDAGRITSAKMHIPLVVSR